MKSMHIEQFALSLQLRMIQAFSVCFIQLRV